MSTSARLTSTKEVKERYDFLKAQVTDVEKAKSELTRMIAELCSEMEELFTTSFKQINTHFQQIFKELFGGGHARLYLSDESNVLESGIEIEVSPPGKVIKNLSALSGGEQALVAISIYFAILSVNPAPFCFLDEIEAALDDVNVARYAQYLRRMTDPPSSSSSPTAAVRWRRRTSCTASRCRRTAFPRYCALTLTRSART